MSDPSLAIQEAIAAQRRAASPTTSVWVAANAGSGKTKVLTDRIARLLLAGSDPSRILAVTYTKAAAAEMKTRLFETLGAWAIAPDEALASSLEKLSGGEDPMPRDAAQLARARQLFARSLDTPGGLKIQTIHAFCQTILQRFPIEAGVPPGFQVLEDNEAAVLAAEAQESLLGADEEAIEDFNLLASALSEEALTGLLKATQTRHREASAILAGGMSAALERLSQALEIDPTESSADIMRRASDTVRVAAQGALLALSLGGKTGQDLAHAISEALQETAVEKAFADLKKALLTDKGNPRLFRFDKSIADHPDVCRFVADPNTGRDGEATRAILNGNEQLNGLATYQRTAALLRLSQRFRTGYAAAKAVRGALDFDDLLARTRRLLQGDSGQAAWVLYKLDQGIDHVLVDEAQDTSPDQWDLLAPLFAELEAGQGARQEIVRTRFIVGDEKQSIYSFQGADPFRFVEERGKFLADGSANRRSVALGLSWRTAQVVLDAVDSVWVAGERQATLAFPGEASRHIAQRGTAPGRVEIWPVAPKPSEDDQSRAWDAPLDQERETSPRLALARAIATTIQGWLNPTRPLGIHDKATGAVVPASANDIMILVRRRDALFTNIIRSLKELRIPVAGADRLVLAQELAVMDLLAVAKAALLPEDDLTVATVMRGPFVGLLDDDRFLLPLAKAKEMPGARTTLWEALLRSDDPVYAQAKAVLSDAIGRVGQLAPYEFFAALLERPLLDGRTGWEHLVQRLGPECREPIEALLGRALAHAQRGTPSLERFVFEIETGAGELKREQDQSEAGVRVMTVHGSKGLEAPIVILPDTTGKPRGSSHGLFFDPERLAWALASKKEEDTRWVRLLREADDARTEAEARRLLYVAMTRARDRLILCGAWHGRGQGKTEGVPGADKASWYTLLHGALTDGEACETPFGEGRAWGQNLTASALAPIEAGKVVPDVTWARTPPPPDPILRRRAAPSALAEDSPEPSAPSPLGLRGAGLRRGVLIHELLQRLPDVPPTLRTQRALERLQREPTLSDPNREEILARCFAVLDHPDFAPLFGPSSRAEVSVAGRVGHLDVVGAIDRVVLAKDQVWIVDYKTNRSPPLTEGDVPPLYARQMAVYRALLAEIYSGCAIRCSLLWTDEPRLMDLSDGLLDAALQDLGVPPKSIPTL